MTHREGKPLVQPNGVASDPDGNVVVNVGDNGLVILPDGTNYFRSVRFGSVSRIRPGQEAKVIAAGIPSAASMGYDSKQKQLIIPMNNNNNNALAFIKIED